MAVVALLCQDEGTRRELSLSIEQMGHRVAPALELPQLLETVREQLPSLVVAAETGASSPRSENVLAELGRESPLLPVVVALSPRSAARAVELLRLGAYEVVAPPWTVENLAAPFSKALRFKGTSFEVARPSSGGEPRPIRKSAAAVAAGVLALLIFVRLAWRGAPKAPPAAPPAQWELPYAHPAGLAFDGESFWIPDWFSQTVYVHERRGLRAIRTVHLPAEVPGAAAFASGAFWLSSGKKLVRHMLDDKLSVLSMAEDAQGQSVGMVYDGLYLWTCDSKGARLHKRILDADLTEIASYRYPGTRPAALAFDGKTLWSVDAGNRDLLEHDIADPERVRRRIPLRAYRDGDWKPVGLAFDGVRFWTAAEHLPKADRLGRVFMHPVDLNPGGGV